MISGARTNGWLWNVYRSTRMRVLRRRHGLSGLHPTTYIVGRPDAARDLRTGEYSFVGRNCRIGPRVTLGRYVMFAPEVAVVGGDHRVDRPGVPTIFAGRPTPQSTVVDDDCWVGYRAILIAGVHVGRGAVVAAGAVVTRDVAPFTVVAGVPARVVRMRFTPSEQEEHERMLALPARRGEFAGRR